MHIKTNICLIWAFFNDYNRFHVQIRGLKDVSVDLQEVAVSRADEEQYWQLEISILLNLSTKLEMKETEVVYHLHQKPIWFQTVQMERNNFDWKIPFGARAFHFRYDRKKIYRKGPGARWKTQQNVNGTK